MNHARIVQLAGLLPTDTTLFTAGRKPGDPAPRLVQRLAIAGNDPAFGHRFLMEFVQRNESLPAAVHEVWLRRAYDYYATDSALPDQILLQVEQLVLLPNQFVRSVLHALLVCRDCTYAQIAEQLALCEHVIRVYEQLHWNMRARADEPAYLAQIVLPEGRLHLLKTDAVDDLPFETRLLIAAHHYGMEEVLWLAGLSTGQTDPPSVTQSLKDFEETLLQNAVKLARSGALNACSAPGIAHAKTLLVAKNNHLRCAIVCPVAVDIDHAGGFGSLGFGTTLR